MGFVSSAVCFVDEIGTQLILQQPDSTNLFAGFSAVLEFSVAVFGIGIAHHSKAFAATFAYFHRNLSLVTFTQKEVNQIIDIFRIQDVCERVIIYQFKISRKM